jgi:hypothetical protein
MAKQQYITEEIIHKPPEADVPIGAGVKTLYVTSKSPWENGHRETFNGNLREVLLSNTHPRGSDKYDGSVSA